MYQHMLPRYLVWGGFAPFPPVVGVLGWWVWLRFAVASQPEVKCRSQNPYRQSNEECDGSHANLRVLAMREDSENRIPLGDGCLLLLLDPFPGQLRAVAGVTDIRLGLALGLVALRVHD